MWIYEMEEKTADYISSAYKLFEINAQDMKDLIRFWLSHRIKWAL